MTGNASDWFVDRHVREGRSEKVAFREASGRSRQLSFGELAEATDNVAGAFNRAGQRAEERAAMIVLDQIEFPEIFWGALKAGVVPVPINTLLGTDVYRAILTDSRATSLFVSEELWPVVGPAVPDCPALDRVIFIPAAEGAATPDGTMAYTDFLAGAEPRKGVDRSGDEVAFWLYSSGSTGQPKGVRHVHSALRETAQTYGAQVLGIAEDDTIYSVAKLFFAYGLGNGMTFPMSVGATAVLFNGRPTPDVVSEILAAERPTIFCGVPTLYAALLHHWEGAPRPDAPIRLSISAGEALPAEIGKAWQGHWGGDILDGVGSTEMLHIFLSNRADDIVYGTSGIAVPGYDLRLVNEDGADCAEGEIGELLVRGGSGAQDYWNQRGKSRATFEGEWTRTGDKYERDASGRYIYCGRTDDMFKVSGIWVSPFEVEQALASHPSVLEAAVVAHRDADGLEKPRAFIVLKAPLDNHEAVLKEHIKDAIGKWKYPRWIEVVDDLPKTATGKIQRFKLRDGA